jgi:hypothetical protein
MGFSEKIKHMGAELKGHAPFTIFGATVGILLMLLFKDVSTSTSGKMFAVFHPAHVLLSAMATTAMFGIHRKSKNLFLIVLVGFVGSIGVATLSDSIIPFFGEEILGLRVPTHADIHVEPAPEETGHEGHGHAASECSEDGKLHFGFIEHWYIINPAALLGIAIAIFLPRTKSPHTIHVLVSTWASSAHILMNTQTDFSIAVIAGIFIILFISVWLPCCISDIVFPLLFVRSDIKLTTTCVCTDHTLHSHPHEHEHSEKCPEGQKEDC